jgi:protease-4
VRGIVLNVELLSVGWAKVQEIRKYLAFFRESGKDTIAYLERASEKEYYLASVCQEIYVPPTAQLSLTGLRVGGVFLRGAFEKVGIEPQVKRIGKYKSAGDQLLRKDMSEAQREQLTALIDDIYSNFLSTVAEVSSHTHFLAFLRSARSVDVMSQQRGKFCTLIHRSF